ncbi:MAG TPA: winged helix-turn-helix domain-containing protein [Candidatus Acidoferrum sp.]|nr:winged helix-turn-helix domain-containing protein [Candidatus Acidoferrum sp.]
MRRSKLERYVDILNELANTGQLKLNQIMNKSNLNGTKLRDYLDFLIKQDLVEERTPKKNCIFFAITQRGLNVLRHFRELAQETSVIEEE